MSETDLPETDVDTAQLDEDDRLKPEFVRSMRSRMAMPRVRARWSSRSTPPTSPICSS